MSEDTSPDVIKKTQNLLGKYVKKPPLTDKLLKKPPFRFLHDIINTVIKETGFLKGVFSDEELNSENVKEKDAKIAFLNKLIEAVKFITKIDLAVRSSKIVAGLEPTKTNLLLQAIGKAIDAKSNAAEYISQLNSGKNDNIEKKKIKKPNTLKGEKVKNDIKTKNTKADSTSKVSKSKKTVIDSPKNKVVNTPKDSSRNKNRDKQSKIKNEDKNKSIKKEEKKENNEVIHNDILTELNNSDNHIINPDVLDSSDNQIILNSHDVSDKANDVKEAVDGTEKVIEVPKLEVNSDGAKDEIMTTESTDNNSRISTANLTRPKSARPKSGERKILKHKEQRSNNLETEEAVNPIEMSVNPTPQRPKSSLRPPSVRPSSARPGAPRLRPDSALPLHETVTMGNINVIVENVDNADDEETVIIQTTSELTEESITPVNVPEDNKGQLVEQILEQIQEEGENVRKKIEIDWDQTAVHTKDGATKEITQLRSLIQSLTRTANPLGKLMNYLHEDIDAMQGELQMWSNTKNQLFSEIHKQKRHTAESSKPLLVHLEQLQEDIKKQEQEILNIRGNILRNELRIKELLNI